MLFKFHIYQHSHFRRRICIFYLTSNLWCDWPKASLVE